MEKSPESVIKTRRQLRDRLLQAGVLWRHSQELKGNSGTLKKAPSGIHAIHQSTARVTIWFCVCVCVPGTFTLKVYPLTTPFLWCSVYFLRHRRSPLHCGKSLTRTMSHWWDWSWTVSLNHLLFLLWSFSLSHTFITHCSLISNDSSSCNTSDFKWDSGEITSKIWVKLSL